MPVDIGVDKAPLKGWSREASHRARRHCRLASRWNKIHYSIGLLATALSAIVGVTVLADLIGATAAGVIALAAALAGAVVAFLKPGDRRTREFEMTARWRVFEEKAKIGLLAQPLEQEAFNDLKQEYLDLVKDDNPD